ncbi:unnamed protein product [Calicophoron daubneyi]|uniref:Alpha-galactosidase n=1 Tax=Calicophoron daubneyi TaxID=300641 RepID=A0AAV2TGW5_CALDB
MTLADIDKIYLWKILGKAHFEASDHYIALACSLHYDILMLLITIYFIWEFCTIRFTEGFDREWANRPPMGWRTGPYFGCQTDCINVPDKCISERMINTAAYRLREYGLHKAGYNHILIDDCWAARTRDVETKELRRNTTRFPSDFTVLSRVLSFKGYRMGLYLNYGKFTPHGYPGSADNLENDAKNMKKWNVKYVTMDAYSASDAHYSEAFANFSHYLNTSSILSCGYPAYIDWFYNPKKIDWKSLKSNCNSWSLFSNPVTDWDSIVRIHNQYKDRSIFLANQAGPQHWNDPGPLLIPNYVLSHSQQLVQMGLWCMFAAPLFISTDLENPDPFSIRLLKNSRLIEIDQDEGGHQAVYMGETKNIHVWIRRLAVNGCWAIAFVNLHLTGGPVHVVLKLSQMNVTTHSKPYSLFLVHDVYLDKLVDILDPSGSLKVTGYPIPLEFEIVCLETSACIGDLRMRGFTHTDPWLSFSLILLALWMLVPTDTLDNGLALKPPMGWMSWQRFRCQTDCRHYPDDCISERLIKRTVDRMISTKLKDAGYQYVMIDDCWQLMQRDPKTQKLVPDPNRFPGGLKKLSDYVHEHGLLLGIYLDFGNLTCEGYPGTLGHLKEDADSLAGWGVDYVKVDGCYSHPQEMPDGYEQLGKYLNQTGRPMVYSCSYPMYSNWQSDPKRIDWVRLAKNCNQWRLFGDVQDSWASVSSIINQYANHQSLLFTTNGVGHWNDMDMLVIGNYGLSEEQMRVQMGMWSLLAVPLIISTDLDTIDAKSLELLKNPNLLEINQGSGGWPSAILVKKERHVQIWLRKLLEDWVVGFVNHASGGYPERIDLSLNELSKAIPAGKYRFVDVFTGKTVGNWNTEEKWTVRVNPPGIVLYRIKRAQSQSAIHLERWFEMPFWRWLKRAHLFG